MNEKKKILKQKFITTTEEDKLDEIEKLLSK